jgi:hypothetical protein
MSTKGLKGMTAKGMDIRLKAIQPKAIWGCRSLLNKRSLLAIGNDEYIVCSGGGLMIFSDKPEEETHETYMCNDHHDEVLSPTFIAISPDNKFILSLVDMKVTDPHTAHMLIYTTEYLRVEFRAPKLVSFQVGVTIIDTIIHNYTPYTAYTHKRRLYI